MRSIWWGLSSVALQLLSGTAFAENVHDTTGFPKAEPGPVNQEVVEKEARPIVRLRSRLGGSLRHCSGVVVGRQHVLSDSGCTPSWAQSEVLTPEGWKPLSCQNPPGFAMGTEKQFIELNAVAREIVKLCRAKATYGEVAPLVRAYSKKLERAKPIPNQVHVSACTVKGAKFTMTPARVTPTRYSNQRRTLAGFENAGFPATETLPDPIKGTVWGDEEIHTPYLVFPPSLDPALGLKALRLGGGGAWYSLKGHQMELHGLSHALYQTEFNGKSCAFERVPSDDEPYDAVEVINTGAPLKFLKSLVAKGFEIAGLE